jgi:ankyrin repeat protein
MPMPPSSKGLCRRSCVLAALSWLGGPAWASSPLQQAMRRAEALRDEAQRAGDQPYGAVVLRGETIVGAAASRVITANDPNAHAEREALRDAMRRLGSDQLRGCVLVSTSRPCALCEAAAGRAGIERMVYGVALTDAGAPRAALVAAAEAGDLVMVRRLLDAGAPVDARDARGRTALLAATQANRIDAARLLIERGADVNAKDEMQDSPFLYAGAEGRLEILRLSLAAGADLKSTNRYGGTALIPAAHHGHVETVRELLKTKIDIDHVNRLGWTALLEAIILGDGGAAHTEIVRLLVAHGARLQLADAQGVTPLAHAEQRGQKAVVEILRRAGARSAP